MPQITVLQIKAAISKAHVKLTRQQQSVDATLAELAMFEQQLEQVQDRPDRAPVAKTRT